MSALQRWLWALLTTTVAVLVSYEWLDRPIAYFANGRLPQHRDTLFAPLTHLPDPLIPAAAIVFVCLGLWAFSGRRWTRCHGALAAASLALPMAESVKSQLKFAFGRTWPETWVQNNPSLIHDGVYGFFWFHGGPGYASFPSGHMTATCALAAVLWIHFPRLRPLWTLAVLAVAVGLIGADFHFLSDVIAGSFVGVTVGWMTSAIAARLAPAQPGTT